MPRKKITKQKPKASPKLFSPVVLTKVEKEFFTIPANLVKKSTKQLTVLQKKNSKLSKAVTKAAMQAEKLEKKLQAIKQSKKTVKRSVATALKKQHQATLKQHATLSKEHKALVASLTPLETFHAKFNFLSKQLVQLDKEWTALQKSKTAKQSNVLKIKPAKKKKNVAATEEPASLYEGTSSYVLADNNKAHMDEELAQSEEINA